MDAIARHKLVDHLRRYGRRETLDDPIDGFDEGDLPVPAESHATHDLAVLIERLPEAEQRTVLLIKVEGLPAIDAARRAGVSVSAIRVQAHRGLKRLAALIRSERED